MSSDSQYIEATINGDPQAFGHLVRAYQDRLFHSFCGVTGCREEAEDVVQEAFVQAFVRLESFERRSAFYTWLYRIAMNISISRNRRRRPLATLEGDRSAGLREPVDPSDSAHQALERSESIQMLRAALVELSEEHRRILVLREMDGLDYESISEILSMPLGTVRSRLHRARLQMREVLQRNSNQMPADRSSDPPSLARQPTTPRIQPPA